MAALSQLEVLVVDCPATAAAPRGHLLEIGYLAASFSSFDRLRALTTELKPLIAAGTPVSLRLGAGPALDESRLASALRWM